METKRHLLKSISAINYLVRSGRPTSIISNLTEMLTGINPYTSYLRSRSKSDVHLISLPDIDANMYIDVSDEGISKNLLIYGTHEHTLVKTYIEQLKDMSGEAGKLTILEAGANIGYYLLAAAKSVDCEIIAFEPVPRNRAILRENIILNDIQDRIVVESAALASTTRPTKFILSEKSNRHRLQPGDKDTESGDSTIPVNSISIADYLNRNNINPNRIDAIRMDVEGGEVEIIDGMSTLINQCDNLLCYIEVHPNIREEEDLTTVYQTFMDNDFELITAMNEGITSTPWPGPLDVNGFNDLIGINHAFGFIARRN